MYFDSWNTHRHRQQSRKLGAILMRFCLSPQNFKNDIVVLTVDAGATVATSLGETRSSLALGYYVQQQLKLEEPPPAHAHAGTLHHAHAHAHHHQLYDEEYRRAAAESADRLDRPTVVSIGSWAALAPATIDAPRDLTNSRNNVFDFNIPFRGGDR